jgi:hypothetical protein
MKGCDRFEPVLASQRTEETGSQRGGNKGGWARADLKVGNVHSRKIVQNFEGD